MESSASQGLQKPQVKEEDLQAKKSLQELTTHFKKQFFSDVIDEDYYYTLALIEQLLAK